MIRRFLLFLPLISLGNRVPRRGVRENNLLTARVSRRKQYAGRVVRDKCGTHTPLLSADSIRRFVRPVVNKDEARRRKRYVSATDLARCYSSAFR